jgi:hypothetical protein
VVEELDPQDLAGVRHPPSEQQVLGAGVWVAARVRVEQDDAGRSAEERLFQDLPRLDGRPGQGAAEDLPVGDQAPLEIEEEGAEDFLIAEVIAEMEIARRLGGPEERRPTGDLSLSQAASQLSGGKENREAVLAQAASPEVLGAGDHQPIEPSMLVEQLPGKLEGCGFRPAGVAQDREQFGIGENMSPGAQQPPLRADRRLPDPETSWDRCLRRRRKGLHQLSRLASMGRGRYTGTTPVVKPGPLLCWRATRCQRAMSNLMGCRCDRLRTTYTGEAILEGPIPPATWRPSCEGVEVTTADDIRPAIRGLERAARATDEELRKNFRRSS